MHADGSAQTRVLKFAAGSHDFEFRSKNAVASESYVRLRSASSTAGPAAACASTM